MGMFVAICKFIIACIFYIDANTFPIDSSRQFIDLVTCSESFDTTEANHMNARPLNNVTVQESLKSVTTLKKTHGKLKVSDIIISYIFYS